MWTKLRHPIIRFWLSYQSKVLHRLPFLLLLLFPSLLIPRPPFSYLSFIPFIHHPCIFIDLPALSFCSDRHSDWQIEHKPKRQMYVHSACVCFWWGKMVAWVCLCVHVCRLCGCLCVAGGDVLTFCLHVKAVSCFAHVSCSAKQMTWEPIDCNSSGYVFQAVGSMLYNKGCTHTRTCTCTL